MRTTSALIVLLLATTSLAQTGPVAAGLSGYVNKFTGDFNYQIPLMTITGPNGEAFPLALNYQGGIRVDQEASWVGLGWDLSIGEVVRSVNGFPDDWKGKSYVVTQKANSGASVVTKEDLLAYGPVHFKDIPDGSDFEMLNSCATCVAMDLYSSRRNRVNSEASFEFPDYDDYAVVGPGLSGALSMHLFDYSSIFYKPDGEGFDYTNSGSDYWQTSHTPTFVFGSGNPKKVVAPFFSQTEWDSELGYYPGAYPSGGYLTTPWIIGSSTSLNLLTPGQLSSYPFGPDARMIGDRMTPRSGYYVEYFTNLQIKHHYDNTAPIDGFLDWGSHSGNNVRGNALEYDADGIGAIRVTDPSGFTYHYSLPTYVYSETAHSFGVGWQTLGTGFTGPLNTISKNNMYAVSWKLTAITGPDFVDNGNSVLGDADTGYWIAFDYAQWTNDMSMSYPYYGYQIDAINKNRAADYPGPSPGSDSQYVPQGSAFTSTGQVHYLNTIRTATQTAFFIKDVRLDGHGNRRQDGKVIPKLYLKHIVLMDNDDIQQGWFPSSSRPEQSAFSILSSTLPGEQNVYNIHQYAQFQTAIEERSLRTITLDQDYHLARKVHNNIRSGNAAIAPTSGQGEVAGEYVFQPYPNAICTGSNYEASGKLTLNRVTVYENGHQRILPSYDLGYISETEIDEQVDPLDFDPNRKDHFGYFKSDHVSPRGGYTTTRSKDHVDAWSLNSIEDQQDGLLKIEYESDEYEAVGYNDQSILPQSPTRFFWVGEFYEQNTDLSLSLRDEDGEREICGDADIDKVSLYSHENLGIGLDMWLDDIGTSCINSNNPIEVVGNYNFIITDDYMTPNPPAEAYVRVTYNKAYGGGVRVRRLSIKDQGISDSEYAMSFDYEGGVSTIEPDPYERDGYQYAIDGAITSSRVVYSNKTMGERHAPSPLVGYSKVTESVLDPAGQSSLGSIVTEFGNYQEPYRLDSRDAVNGLNHYGVAHCTQDMSQYGSPLNVRVLDANGVELSSTSYVYEYPDDASTVMEEVFYRDGSFYFGSDYYHSHTAFYKTWIQRALKEVVQHVNGNIIRTTVSNKDPYTGADLSSSSSQEEVGSRSNGTSTPAYTVTAYEAMGAKYDDVTNKNLLAAPTISENGIDPPSRSEWSEAHAIRRFDGSAGEFVTDEDVTTQWAPTKSHIGTADHQWKYLGRTTLFSPRMQLLESKDMFDGYRASKLSGSGDRTIAEVSNCNYASFTASSFETRADMDPGTPQSYWFEGEISAGANNESWVPTSGSNVTPHSGTHVLAMPAGNAGSAYHIAPSTIQDGTEVIQRGLLTGREYRAVVWVHSTSPASARLMLKLNGNYQLSSSMTKTQSTLVVGSWVRLDVRLAVPADFVASSPGDGLTASVDNVNGASEARFDDLMLYPVDAGISVSVWNERRGLVTEQMGGEGFVTRYVYDAGGNVTSVYQETETGIHLVSTSEIGFAKQN